jgi:hypothetical protein
MKKLTKHQRQYRKRKKDSLKDFRTVPREGKEPGVRVTRRPLKVNVSQEAFDRLTQLAAQADITKWEMLTRMIIQGIPGYASYSSSISKTQRYHWPTHLLEPKDRTFKYKGETGSRQINYSITSTAWKKLECHKTAIGQSKARIIQFLILRYKPLTKVQLAKAKEAVQNQAADGSAQKVIRTSSWKPSGKFVDVGDRFIHVKGIPEELWDEEELNEIEQLYRRKCLNKLARLEANEQQNTKEWEFWSRMLETTAEA